MQAHALDLMPVGLPQGFVCHDELPVGGLSRCVLGLIFHTIHPHLSSKIYSPLLYHVKTGCVSII